METMVSKFTILFQNSGQYGCSESFTQRYLTANYYFYISRNMNAHLAIDALSALAQETRLGVFRRLMRALPAGMAAGTLGEELGVPASTLSAHLAILSRAGLIRAERKGRVISYAAELKGIRALLAFLVEDCCNGESAACSRLLQQALSPCCPTACS